MRTTLSPEQLADLAAQGVAKAAASPFVNPDAVAQALKVLRERGEDWAASVLMRDLSRRSLASPRLPWFENGELETLILADRAEWEQLQRAATA